MYGSLCLGTGLISLLLGGVDWMSTTRFVAEANTAVAEVVSSADYRGRYGGDRCCVTIVAVVQADGTRLTAVWREPVRYTPGGAINVLYRKGPSFQPARIVPDDERTVWGGTRLGLRMGATLTGAGLAIFWIASSLRRRAQASA